MGVIDFLLADRRQRQAFSETLKSLKVKTKLEFQHKKQVFIEMCVFFALIVFSNRVHQGYFEGTLGYLGWCVLEKERVLTTLAIVEIKIVNVNFNVLLWKLVSVAR